MLPRSGRALSISCTCWLWMSLTIRELNMLRLLSMGPPIGIDGGGSSLCGPFTPPPRLSLTGGALEADICTGRLVARKQPPDARRRPFEARANTREQPSR